MKPKLLIVDDEKPIRDVMSRILKANYTCLTAPNAEQALTLVDENPDLALLLTDYKMPGDNGITLIGKAKGKLPALAAILITAFGEIELAVEAMKSGADDFLEKPITDIDQLEQRAAKAIEKHAALRMVEARPLPANGRRALTAFTGTSPVMERVYTLIQKVAPTSATVLVEGLSGTGKELVARALHDLSPRAKGPFVAVECAALSKELLESELFGYTPGTFTGGLKDGKAGCFEAANGGTLFLDEIGEIDLGTQVKLLRAIESRTITRLGSTEAIPVDFRLVAATNKNLAALVRTGTFREDLFYRLNVIDIPTPALKDHKEDIAALLARFLGDFAKIYGNTVTGIEPAALKTLKAYDWPGNVRQLRNVVEKMVVLATGPTLTEADIPEEIKSGDAPNEVATPRGDTTPRGDAPNGDATLLSRRNKESPSSSLARQECLAPDTCTLADTEKRQILAALDAARGNKTKAAEALGISRRTLHRKLNEWGLS